MSAFQNRLFASSPLPWRLGREFPSGSIQILDANGQQVMVFHGSLLEPHVTAMGLIEAMNGSPSPSSLMRVELDPKIPNNHIRIHGIHGQVVTGLIE